MTTIADFRTRVKAALGIAGASPERGFDDASLDQHIRQAVEEFSRYVPVETNAELTLAAGARGGRGADAGDGGQSAADLPAPAAGAGASRPLARGPAPSRWGCGAAHVLHAGDGADAVARRHGGVACGRVFTAKAPRDTK